MYCVTIVYHIESECLHSPSETKCRSHRQAGCETANYCNYIVNEENNSDMTASSVRHRVSVNRSAH